MRSYGLVGFRTNELPYIGCVSHSPAPYPRSSCLSQFGLLSQTTIGLMSYQCQHLFITVTEAGILGLRCQHPGVQVTASFCVVACRLFLASSHSRWRVSLASEHKHTHEGSTSRPKGQSTLDVILSDFQLANL